MPEGLFMSGLLLLLLSISPQSAYCQLVSNQSTLTDVEFFESHTDDSINLELPAGQGNIKKWKIVDLYNSGIMRSKGFTGEGNKNALLDISSLPRGDYLVTIWNENGQKFQNKFFKD